MNLTEYSVGARFLVRVRLQRQVLCLPCSSRGGKYPRWQEHLCNSPRAMWSTQLLWGPPHTNFTLFILSRPDAVMEVVGKRNRAHPTLTGVSFLILWNIEMPPRAGQSLPTKSVHSLQHLAPHKYKTPGWSLSGMKELPGLPGKGRTGQYQPSHSLHLGGSQDLRRNKVTWSTPSLPRSGAE